MPVVHLTYNPAYRAKQRFDGGKHFENATMNMIVKRFFAAALPGLLADIPQHRLLAGQPFDGGVEVRQYDYGPNDVNIPKSFSLVLELVQDDSEVGNDADLDILQISWKIQDWFNRMGIAIDGYTIRVRWMRERGCRVDDEGTNTW